MSKRFFSRLRAVLILSLLFSPGCAWLNRKQETKPVPEKTSKPRPGAVKSQPKPVDAEAQQRFYDQGLRYYTEEKFAEAKKAWQTVLQLGPSTALADKARIYLQKTEQSLKTLQEYEKK